MEGSKVGTQPDTETTSVKNKADTAPRARTPGGDVVSRDTTRAWSLEG